LIPKGKEVEIWPAEKNGFSMRPDSLFGFLMHQLRDGSADPFHASLRLIRTHLRRRIEAKKQAADVIERE
jgi:hypothetical protein